ncbi:MAG: hypothetical protein Q4G43_12610 [Mobilicoccus sp.]|nr:hypothetical protein [Mobilicoccus sp.]
MTDDLDRRLRAALEPTDTDHARADRVVDDVVAGGRAPSTPRRRWFVPAAAAALALALAGGVGFWSAQREGEVVATTPSDIATVVPPAALPEPQTFDVFPLIDLAFPTVSWVTGQRPGVVVRYAPLCEVCDGVDLFPAVLDFARNHPEYWVAVVAAGGESVVKEARQQLGEGLQAGRATVAVVAEQEAETRRLLPDGWDTGDPIVLVTDPENRVTASTRDPMIAEDLLLDPTPGMVTVRCTDDGTTVEPQEVAAGPTGIWLRVVNDTPRPVFFYSGPPSGELLPSEPDTMMHAGSVRDRLVQFEPGRHGVGCVHETSAHLTVTDPGGLWRGGVVEAGCPADGEPLRAGGPGRGASPEAAVRSWPLGDGVSPMVSDPGVTVHRADMGYAQAPQEYWIVSRDGTPESLLVVTREGEEYVATEAWICQGAF